MKLIQKLKGLEKSFVFLRWATDARFGKLNYIGEDFVEFEALDDNGGEYTETILINSQLILEVVVSGIDIARVLAEVSVKKHINEESDEAQN